MQESFSNALLQIASDPRVSDIILSPGEPLTHFVFGDLQRNREVVVTEEDFREVTAQSGMNIESLDDDGKWSFGPALLRCNLITYSGKKQLCMRPMPTNLPTLKSVDFPEHEGLRSQVLSRSKGIFFITGETDTGKSSTGAAIIHEWAQQERKHVLTFEDPIEYIYPRNLPSLVTQRELNRDTANVLRALGGSMRQKPRLILIGEVRDREMAELALNLASTGHYIITTLHCGNSCDAIEAFLKFFPKDRWAWGCYMLSKYLKGVLAQRLEKATDDSRRYVLHEYLAMTEPVSAIISDAGRDENRLKGLPGEIASTGFSGAHISFETSLRRWLDLGASLPTDCII